MNQPVQKVTIVAPMIARYDAISAAVRHTYHMLAADDGFDVQVITQRNDFPDVPAIVLSGLTDVLVHPVYLEADCLIYHYGVFNDLFNALILGNGHARQIVYFHNVTPKEHVAREHSYLIEASHRQISNLQYADEVWAVSSVNTDVLVQHGIDPARIHLVPLVVDSPEVAHLSGKRVTPIELLFIGRIVMSKGVLDLVQAIDLVRQGLDKPFRLRLVGSLEWSDHEYLRKVQHFVASHHLNDVVEFCGTVDDAERERLYHSAHILTMPSYHEGFCKPVVEGLRSGCIPVGYDAYNLPHIANGFGRLVAPGDWRALSTALIEVATSIERAHKTPDEPLLPLDRGNTSLRSFETDSLDYIEEYSFEHLAALTRSRVLALLTDQSIVSLSVAHHTRP